MVKEMVVMRCNEVTHRVPQIYIQRFDIPQYNWTRQFATTNCRHPKGHSLNTESFVERIRNSVIVASKFPAEELSSAASQPLGQ